MQVNQCSILYHYTDFNALDGILGHAQLRLNNVLNMNDASEMNLFMNSLCRNIADRFLEEGKEEKAGRTWRIFMQEQKDRFSYSAYAACFSRYRDDAAQWERYGNRGHGVCIAFDESLLRRMAVGVLSLQTVIYSDDVQDHHLVDDIYEILKDLPVREDMEEGQTLQLREALNRAWAASAVYKHPSFASENEVRLLVSPFEQGYFDVQPQYHISKDRIKKYYPLDLERMCTMVSTSMEELIPELIIGPESTQSLPILQDYLHSYGYHDLAKRISYSGCPLRRTNL